mmetsp:Transcript_13615/g.32980  ORF Transcript_13615/g.32980 Transcript_13615/m.32980 type:complete len:213 (-) Transcript_13615:259-897(-)
MTETNTCLVHIRSRDQHGIRYTQSTIPCNLFRPCTRRLSRKSCSIRRCAAASTMRPSLHACLNNRLHSIALRAGEEYRCCATSAPLELAARTSCRPAALGRTARCGQRRKPRRLASGRGSTVFGGFACCGRELCDLRLRRCPGTERNLARTRNVLSPNSATKGPCNRKHCGMSMLTSEVSSTRSCQISYMPLNIRRMARSSPLTAAGTTDGS